MKQKHIKQKVRVMTLWSQEKRNKFIAECPAGGDQEAVGAVHLQGVPQEPDRQHAQEAGDGHKAQRIDDKLLNCEKTAENLSQSCSNCEFLEKCRF